MESSSKVILFNESVTSNRISALFQKCWDAPGRLLKNIRHSLSPPSEGSRTDDMRFMPVFTGQDSWTTGTHRGCSNFLWTTLAELVASYPCTRSSTVVPVLVPVVLYSVYMHTLNRKWILLSRSYTSSEVMTSEILARKRDVVPYEVYTTQGCYQKRKITDSLLLIYSQTTWNDYPVSFQTCQSHFKTVDNNCQQVVRLVGFGWRKFGGRYLS